MIICCGASLADCDTPRHPPLRQPIIQSFRPLRPCPLCMSSLLVHVSNGIYDVFTSPTSGPAGTPNCTVFISPKQGSTSMKRTPSKVGKAAQRLWTPFLRLSGREDGLGLGTVAMSMTDFLLMGKRESWSTKHVSSRFVRIQA